MAATGPDLQPGEMLPGTKYRIVKQIGAGGMGVVYQVVKPPEIQGVLKLMSRELTEHEEFRTRFLDEVRVLAQLDHPSIVKVFDYDALGDGTPFYVMELLHGRTVRDVLATMGTVPPRVAFEVTRQLCEALHAAHTHDILVIHRDIKPENLFLHAPRHGEPVLKLIDFGVVAVADRQHDGAFVGTWKYAAPEQIRGERATPATDLYAVGLVLYEMLCGRGPFDHHENGPPLAQAHLREAPPPVSRFAPWVPASIVQLIAAALAKDPRRRPRDAHRFAERLRELEWASNGQEPQEGASQTPLSRILDSTGGAASAGSRLVAAPPEEPRLEGLRDTFASQESDAGRSPEQHGGRRRTLVVAVAALAVSAIGVSFAVGRTPSPVTAPRETSAAQRASSPEIAPGSGAESSAGTAGDGLSLATASGAASNPALARVPVPPTATSAGATERSASPRAARPAGKVGAAPSAAPSTVAPAQDAPPSARPGAPASPRPDESFVRGL